MTTLDLWIFLVAGIVGILNGSATLFGNTISLAWVIIAIWAVLKLLHILG